GGDERLRFERSKHFRWPLRRVRRNIGSLRTEAQYMERAIGIGVIGMGWMGILHSRAYLQVSDRFPEAGLRPCLISCADDVEARAREAQDRFKFLRRVASWKEL